MRADEHRTEAASEGSEKMRFRLQSSADAWTARAILLERLETNRAAE
jgi:hypothetical protein